jgi:hypothetical protein
LTVPTLRLGRAAAIVAGAAVALAIATCAWAATPAHPPQFLSLDGTTTFSFANYDFDSPTPGAHDADWPVSLVFTGNATEAKVKQALASAFPWPGSLEWGLARTGAGAVLPDPDLGRKTRLCSLLAPGVHYRLYAPFSGSFTSTVYGRYVIGTAHIDIGECGPSPSFGYSETAEARVAQAAAALGWTVVPHAFDMKNPEPLRSEGNHVWLGDGFATQIVVP